MCFYVIWYIFYLLVLNLLFWFGLLLCDFFYLILRFVFYLVLVLGKCNSEEMFVGFWRCGYVVECGMWIIIDDWILRFGYKNKRKCLVCV